MSPKELDRLFQLISEHCTNIAIKRVLERHAEDDKEIRRSGPSESLLTNLRQAFDRGTIKEEELILLLAGAEESGRQHILFYSPKNAAVVSACKNYKAIGLGLLNGKTREELKLPRYYLDLDGVEVSDFRIEQIPNSDYSGWTLKFYSGTERAKYLGIKELGEGKFAREYQRYQSREVLLVKWHSYGVLEIRVATYASMSRKTFNQDVLNVWGAISPTLNRDDFTPLDLRSAGAELVQLAVKRKAEYVLCNADFDDGDDGSISFNPADPDDDLMSSEVRRKALANLKECSRLVVTWLNPKEDKNLPDRLRTEIGCYNTNELRIGAQTTPEAVTYVTNRLRELT